MVKKQLVYGSILVLALIVLTGPVFAEDECVKTGVVELITDFDDKVVGLAFREEGEDRSYNIRSSKHEAALQAAAGLRIEATGTIEEDEDSFADTFVIISFTQLAAVPDSDNDSSNDTGDSDSGSDNYNDSSDDSSNDTYADDDSSDSNDSDTSDSDDSGSSSSDTSDSDDKIDDDDYDYDSE